MRDMKIYWARLPIHTGKVDMIILAVSTSAKYPSAALCSDSDSSRRTIIVQTDESGKPHSVSLMPLIDSMLERAGLQLSDIDLFAVDAGPGSFTGVRIGVTTVNALAYAEKKPIAAVSTSGKDFGNHEPCIDAVVITTAITDYDIFGAGQ